MIGRTLVLVGSLLILLAAVGVVRFDDVYARLHALAKASTIGMLAVLAGAAVTLTHINDITSVVLAAVLQVVTSPVAANAVSTATYLSEGWQRREPDPSAVLAPDRED
jgi:multicomponent Na+:H+ antiporter subunit G